MCNWSEWQIEKDKIPSFIFQLTLAEKISNASPWCTLYLYNKVALRLFHSYFYWIFSSYHRPICFSNAANNCYFLFKPKWKREKKRNLSFVCNSFNAFGLKPKFREIELENRIYFFKYLIELQNVISVQKFGKHKDICIRVFCKEKNQRKQN